MPILRLLLDICLFRKGPEDVPASLFLLGLTLLGYALVGLLLLSFQADLAAALPQVLAEGAMSLVFLRLLLWTANKPHRFLQAAIALMGSDALISLLALPLLLAQGVEGLAGMTHFPLLGMMIWHIAVSGMIFGRSISKSLPIGIAVALLYTVLSVQVMAKLFPVGV
jgi:hypothetical protein